MRAERPIATGKAALCCTRPLSDAEILRRADRDPELASLLLRWVETGEGADLVYASAARLSAKRPVEPASQKSSPPL